MERLVILNEAEVERLLPVSECIEVMEEALTRLARGEVMQPLRSMIRPPGGDSLLGMMPAHRGGDEPAYGLKVICVFPDNPARGLDTHQGLVVLFSGEDGRPLAIANAAPVTAIRTAAVSAVATRLLARPDASRLALIGTGVQAKSHLAAMLALKSYGRIRVSGRTLAKAEEFAKFAHSTCKVAVEPAETVEEAVDGADVIVTVTSSREPVLRREWVSPGAHVNLVGSSIPSTREADGALMAAGALFVDRRESTLNEAGDYLFAVREGLIGSDHIRGELGEVLLGECDGRRSAEEITIFKSLGLAIEDLAAAEALFRKASTLGAGTWLDF